MTQSSSENDLSTYCSMVVIKTPQRHSNSQKSVNILTIPKANLNLALQMTRMPQNFNNLKHCGWLGNSLQH